MPASPVAPGFTPRPLLPPVWGHGLARCNEMLAPSQPRSGLPQPRRLRETLLVSAVVIGIATAGLVFLYLVTQGLLLAVHQFASCSRNYCGQLQGY